MIIQELKLPKDIEIKFYRLSYPSLNTSDLPLSGIYQPKTPNDFMLGSKYANGDERHRMYIVVHGSCREIDRTKLLE